MKAIRRGRAVAVLSRRPDSRWGAGLVERRRSGATILFTSALALLLAAALLIGAAAASATPACDTPASAAQPHGSAQGLPALLALQQAQLTAADGAAGDSFGYSVAIAGDSALVGAAYDDVGTTTDQGSAYVFTRSGSTWSFQAKLTAGDGAANDYFGSSVAIAGETALVGAVLDDVGANTDQGSAYVFVRSGANWTQQAKLTAGDGAVYDEFGCSVAIAGDTALVGADRDDVGTNTDQGSAYVFVRSGANWTQQAKLTAGDGAAYDNFGCSVAIAGDTALVGARYDDVGANTNQGSAYAFVRSGANWTQQAKLTAADGAANDQFGAVAIAGDTALVGAQWDDVGANTDQGSAYVFVRSGANWTQQAKLTAADGVANDYFGGTSAIAGDTALVGESNDDVGATTNQGSAYAFVRSGGTWSQRAKLTANDGAAGDFFGVSVAIAGDTALVGAVGDDVGTTTNQGSAYVFLGPFRGTPPSTTAAVSPGPNAAGWNNTPVTVTLSASDTGSGVAGTEYRLQGAAGWTPYVSAFPVVAEGVSAYEYRSTDMAGNTEAAKTVTVKIDTTAPTTGIPSALPAGWSKKPVTVTLLADGGGSGIASTEYRLQGATAWTPYTAAFPVTTQGQSTWEYRSTDLAGNTEVAKSFAVKIDSQAPSTKAFAAKVKKGKTVKLGYQVNDSAPGCGSAKATIKIYKGKKLKRTLKAAACATNVKKTCSWKATLPKGTYTIKVFATDIAGNAQSKVGSAKLTIK
jgi:hypothetical protein